MTVVSQAAPAVATIPEDRSGFGDHVPQLDSLRGIACLLVLITHLHAVRGLEWIPASLGPIGVGLFFALSGFLITRGLLRGDRSLRRFYNRRTARIFPAYFLTLGLLAIFWPGRELLWAAAFSFNFLYVSGAQEYFHINAGAAPIPPVAHFWSLCVEEHFYWLWPPLVVLGSVRLAAIAATLVVVATPAACWWVMQSLEFRGYRPEEIGGLISRVTFTQLTAIALGCLAAIHERRLARPMHLAGRSIPRLAAASLLALGVAFLIHECCSEWPLIAWFGSVVPSGWRTTVGPAFRPTMLHLACAGAFGAGLSSSFLAAWKPLRRAGRISYGLYLYHLPIYAWLGLAEGEAAVPWTKGAAALLLTFLAAAASYRWIEAPIQSLGKRKDPASELSRATWRTSWGAIASACLLVACGICCVFSGDRQPLLAMFRWTPEIPEEWRLAKLEPTGTAVTAFRWMGVDHMQDPQGFRRNTPIPDKRAGTRRIVTVGDSKTWGMCVREDRTYAAILEQLLRQDGFDAEVINCGKSASQAADVAADLPDLILRLQPDCVIYGATNFDFLPSGVATTGHSISELNEPANAERFRSALGDMRRACDAAAIPFYLFVFSSRPDSHKHFEALAALQELGRAADVTVISMDDYYARFAGTNMSVPFDGHPTEECHRAHAEIIARRLTVGWQRP